MANLLMREPSIPLTGTERGKIASLSVLNEIDEPVGMTVEDEGDLYAHPVDYRYRWISVEWFDSLSCFMMLLGHTSVMFLGIRHLKMGGRSAHHRRDRLLPPWHDAALP